MALKYIVGFIVFGLCAQFGASIRCFECSSVNNSMCLNPTIYDPESVQKYLRTTDCEQSAFQPPSGGAKKMFCRKIVQTILHKGHDADVRVTRGCGWVRHHRDCYKADNEDHLETVCQCFKDDCNSATLVNYSLTSIIINLGFILIRY